MEKKADQFADKYGAEYWYTSSRTGKLVAIDCIVVCMIVTPCACTRGKAIGFVCHLSSVVISKKIATSLDLGIWATHKCNESVEIGEKLASVCLILWHGPQASQIVSFVGHAYRQCLIQAMCFLLMHTTCRAYVGKGRQQTYTCRSMLLLQLWDIDADAARGVLVCALESSSLCCVPPKLITLVILSDSNAENTTSTITQSYDLNVQRLPTWRNFLEGA